MRRGWLCSLVGVALLLLPQRSPAQTVDGYRYVMTGTQTGALPGQPQGPRAMEARAQVAKGVLRLDYPAGAGPISRPGVFVLVDSRTKQVVLIDSIARQSVSFTEGISSVMSGMASMMTLNDTSSVLEDLGPGETVVGYPTRKYRLTVKYSIGIPEMAEAKSTTVQITTMHVSEAVAALDPAFAMATSMTMNPTGPGTARSKVEEQIQALTGRLPKGFALIVEQDIRISNGAMEMATASTMRVTELTRTKLSGSAITVPDGLTKTDFMAYMMQAMQQQRP